MLKQFKIYLKLYFEIIFFLFISLLFFSLITYSLELILYGVLITYVIIQSRFIYNNYTKRILFVIPIGLILGWILLYYAIQILNILPKPFGLLESGNYFNFLFASSIIAIITILFWILINIIYTILVKAKVLLINKSNSAT